VARVEYGMTQKRRRIPPLSTKVSKRSAVVHLGILFVVNDRVLVESTQLSEAELGAEFADHRRGHEAFWSELQHEGRVPRDQEYVEFPRGRSVFNRLTGRHVLYLDKCIIKRLDLVREIKRQLQLPARVEILTDPHYRCPVCLSGSIL